MSSDTLSIDHFDGQAIINGLRRVLVNSGVAPNFISAQINSVPSINQQQLLLDAVLNESIKLRNQNKANISLDLLNCATDHGLDSPWIRDNKVRALIALDCFEGAWRELVKLQDSYKEVPGVSQIHDNLAGIIRTHGLTKYDLDCINIDLRENLALPFFNEINLERGMSKIELNSRLSALVDSNRPELALPILRSLFRSGKSSPYLNLTFARAIKNAHQDLSGELFGLYEQSEIDKGNLIGLDFNIQNGEITLTHGFEEIITQIVNNGREALFLSIDLFASNANKSAARPAHIIKDRLWAALHVELNSDNTDYGYAVCLIDLLYKYCGDDDYQKNMNLSKLDLWTGRPSEARSALELLKLKVPDASPQSTEINDLINISIELQVIKSVKERMMQIVLKFNLPSYLSSALQSARDRFSLVNVFIDCADHFDITYGIDRALEFLDHLGPYFDRNFKVYTFRAQILIRNGFFDKALHHINARYWGLNEEDRFVADQLIIDCQVNSRFYDYYKAIESALVSAVLTGSSTQAQHLIFDAAAEMSRVSYVNSAANSIEYYKESLRLVEHQIFNSVIKPTCATTSNLSALQMEPDVTNRERRAYFPEGYIFDVGALIHNPLVSIIIVSFNSAKDLSKLLPSIKAQSYIHYEVILIDNGLDNTREVLAAYFPEAKYERRDNVGFAYANQIGLNLASGDFILVLNPDTIVGKYMLAELVSALKTDGRAAAAVPKIVFNGEFINLSIFLDNDLALDLKYLESNLNYKKYFVRSGTKESGGLLYPDLGCIGIDIPLPQLGERINIKLIRRAVNSDKITVGIKLGGTHTDIYDVSESGELCIHWSIDLLNSAVSFRVINNAGSDFDADGNPFDRGFGERDERQYDQPGLVGALCGCCALIRRLVLLQRKVFDSTFFAYFEDSELSMWFGRNKLNISYVPNAIVDHRHSESMVENSPLWRLFVGRSRVYFDLAKTNRKLDAIGRRVLEALYERYGIRYGSLVEKLRAFDSEALGSTVSQRVGQTRPAIAVYNSYFSTMGGGERHCLELASRLSLSIEADVYLISESDFSIIKLEEFFLIDLSKCKKMIITNVETASAFFDVFINSTYMSGIIPFSRSAFFITSFPAENVSPLMLDRYVFLHNSSFTAKWSSVYWGKHQNIVVYPIIGFDQKKGLVKEGVAESFKKKKVILTVGRFNYGGHCKNQHLIVAAFKNLVDANLLDAEWSLRLIGSVDSTVSSSLRHFADVVESAKGYNIEIISNAAPEFVEISYAEAIIYCHATGCGLLEVDRPSLQEHFGIAVYESLLYGCIPCVASAAGPLAMTVGLDAAAYFRTSEDIVSALMQCVALTSDAIALNKAQGAVRDRARQLLEFNKAQVGHVLEIIGGRV